MAKGNAAPPVWPFNDGYVLPEIDPPIQVPVMAGFTADDIGTGGQGFGPAAPATVAAYTAEATKTYGDQADGVPRAVPGEPMPTCLRRARRQGATAPA